MDDRDAIAHTCFASRPRYQSSSHIIPRARLTPKFTPHHTQAMSSAPKQPEQGQPKAEKPAEETSAAINKVRVCIG